MEALVIKHMITDYDVFCLRKKCFGNALPKTIWSFVSRRYC